MKGIIWLDGVGAWNAVSKSLFCPSAYVHNRDLPPRFQWDVQGLTGQHFFGNALVDPPEKLLCLAGIQNCNVLIATDAKLSNYIGCLQDTQNTMLKDINPTSVSCLKATQTRVTKQDSSTS